MSDTTTTGNPHLGSTLDDFLEEEGVRAEFEVRAVKEMIAWQIQQAMTERSISKARMAAQMGTSRAQLDRLLDPPLARGARVAERTLRVELQ